MASSISTSVDLWNTEYGYEKVRLLLRLRAYMGPTNLNFYRAHK